MCSLTRQPSVEEDESSVTYLTTHMSRLMSVAATEAALEADDKKKSKTRRGVASKATDDATPTTTVTSADASNLDAQGGSTGAFLRDIVDGVNEGGELCAKLERTERKTQMVRMRCDAKRSDATGAEGVDCSVLITSLCHLSPLSSNPSSSLCRVSLVPSLRCS